ncbi:MAG TPA: hypothetical protein PL182_02885 [Pseudobdellovibrionaceae bacterium]|mgnify:CR=1 FL=1|nr:hypothetical protein [Pseudobdellovibrionaceae bacterium]
MFLKMTAAILALSVGMTAQAQLTGSETLSQGMMCSTNPYPTTIYRIMPSGDDMIVDWYHANGVEFMPIHEGVIVPYSLPILTKRAELLKALGVSQRFTFKASECKEIASKVIHCANYKSVPHDINGHKVRALSTYTSLEQSTSFAGTYSMYATTLYLEVDGQTMFVTMKYDGQDCRFLDKKEDRREQL